MTRPMSGPPVCCCPGSPHECPASRDSEFRMPHRPCPACELHNGESHDAARLTGTECAAEFWSVWRNILRYDDGDPDRGEAIQQANTWLRFATHPHAPEEA